jgi:hypothetical protein
MEKLSFKNYSPRLLAFIICLIVAVKFGLHQLGNMLFAHKSETLYAQVVYLLLTFGTILSILGLINKYCVWKWLLKLLGVCYVKGDWQGYIISSFHEEDDPSKPNIRLFCKVKIVQNLNGFHVLGSYFTDTQMTVLSSRFTSKYEEMEKQPDGSYRVHYFFTNTGDTFHPDHKNYNLNNHQGVCILTCDRDGAQMQGNYFNHERLSHGKVLLQRI